MKSQRVPRSLLAVFVCLAVTGAFSQAFADTWATKSPMPTARNGSSGGVVDGILYVIGGNTLADYLATVEAYDPATERRATTPAVSGLWDRSTGA